MRRVRPKNLQLMSKSESALWSFCVHSDMDYAPYLIGLLIGALVLGITTTTLVYLDKMKKSGQCQDVSKATRDTLYIINLVAAIVSAILVVVMIYLWISMSLEKSGRGGLPLAPAVRRRLARLIPGI